MSDLDYDARLADDERVSLTEAIAYAGCIHTGGVDPETPTGCADCWQIAQHVFPEVERILQARLLDLAQRAEAAEAAVERVRALGDEWDESRRPGMIGIASRIRAALDPQADQ